MTEANAMKGFDRYLEGRFVDQLNELSKARDSWWSKLIADRGLFIAIRKNCISAYAGGASIARVELRESAPKVSVHKKYLVLPPEGENYVELGEHQAGSRVNTVRTEKEFASHLEQIKRTARLLGGEERDGANSIAASHSCFIDFEAAFDGGDAADEEIGRRKTGRVDLVAVNARGKLVFVEAKLYSNGELRSRHGVPRVCEQLRGYAKWIQENEHKIVVAYRRAWSLRVELGLRLPATQPVVVDPVPRLLVYGFDRAQREDLDVDVDKIVGEAKLGGFDRKCVQMFGSPRSFRSDSFA